MIKTLVRRAHKLSLPKAQVRYLNENPVGERFEAKLKEQGILRYKPNQLDILQINVGKMCNQVCKHCHVDAGPDRKEIMTRKTFEDCLKVVDQSKVKMIDLTGGAPEMNPHFRWFVAELSSRGVHTIVRCNLTIILANPKYHDLPQFFAEHNVEVVSSLPSFHKRKTDAQRGEGVFEKSIKALQLLNEVGYGKAGTNLTLNLVYNPTGAFLPASQLELEKEFKRRLSTEHGIVFNQLFAITNMPISRFLEYLEDTGNYEKYMAKLIEAYNPTAALNTMCRNTLSVSWDGFLYDCDFNQMLDLNINHKAKHISEITEAGVQDRVICTGQHCFGCTAGAGSSCGGETN
jgi:radical SAM/Cys-rich protein